MTRLEVHSLLAFSTQASTDQCPISSEPDPLPTVRDELQSIDLWKHRTNCNF
ncbi:hypothetical protein K443DRAFT_680568 [Laccaria amethystina LaAM-08-1]|uniref:Uncharacterized protein n=1 Tax=Laccaria amethystina LaAM-08-1 TaxID=1095629 RepID=A0A0C9X0I3_9AGAR|nr:hypothetical protein K443DRAFT_680568 [Laccaria amethystina LaAM-08-1]